MSENSNRQRLPGSTKLWILVAPLNWVNRSTSPALRATSLRLCCIGCGGHRPILRTIGLPIAFGLGRLLESALFELSALDPLTTGSSLAVLLLVSLTVAWFPAQRAARVDPINALREE